MFGYYSRLAARSFRRNKIITALMVMTIAFGVAASMTTWSVFHAVSGDPIPAKSAQLFFPQIDNVGPAAHGPKGPPPPTMAYTDAVNLMRAHRARYQSAIYNIAPTIVPAKAGKHPFSTLGGAVFSEFFPMVDAPFKYGAPWSAKDGADRARVVVINGWLNDKLFGGADSVGKTIEMSGQAWRVVGVLDHWNPKPRYWNLPTIGAPFNAHGEGVFMPFKTAIAAGIENVGNFQCPGGVLPSQPGFVGRQHSNCVWIDFMVQLDNAKQVAAYTQFFDGYARQQQAIGRFNWAPNNRLISLMHQLTLAGVVPGNVTTSLLVALGLLLVALVNTAGLLLAKFTRRSGEIGVRRALGASRREIYTQFLIEAGMIGVAGGVLGLALTGFGVVAIGWVMPGDIAELAQVNASLLGLTLLLAIIVTAIAGLYPAFRAAHVQPAWQLKIN